MIMNVFQNFFIGHRVTRHYRRLTACICLVIFIFCLLFTLVFTVSFNKSQSLRSKEIVADQSARLDGFLKEVLTIFSDINLNMKNLTRDANGVAIFASNYTLNDYINRLKHNTAVYDYLEDIVVISKNSDIAITAKGTDTKHNYFQNVIYLQNHDASYWENIVLTYSALRIIPEEIYQFCPSPSETQEMRLMAAVQSNLEFDLNIILFINSEKVKQYLRINENHMIQDVFLLDANRSLIFNMSTDCNQKSTPGQDLKNMTIGVQSTSFITDSYLLISEQENYVYGINIDNHNRLRTLLVFLMFVLGLLLVTTMSFVLQIKISQPILSLMQAAQLNPAVNTIANATAHIANAFSQLQDTRQKLLSTNMDSRGNTLLRMMCDKKYYYFNRKYVQEVLDDYKRAEYYHLLHIEIRAESNQQAAETCRRITHALDGSYAGISASVGKHGDAFFYFIPTFNASPTNISFDTLETLISACVPPSAQWIGLLSNSFYEIPEVYTAYQDIQAANLYVTQADIGSVVRLKPVSVIGTVEFPVDFRDELSIKWWSGDQNGIRTMITDLVENMLASGTAIAKIQLLIRMIANTISDIASIGPNTEHEILETERLLLISTTQKCSVFSIDNMLNGLLNFAYLVLDFHTPKNEPLKKLDNADIAQYINEHYTEDLSLDTLSEIFHAPQKYISSYFKKQYGVGYVEYLTKVRITRAAKYIRETDMPIKEIAQKVGYYSLKTFMTAFKKINGVPPGKYREMN